MKTKWIIVLCIFLVACNVNKNDDKVVINSAMEDTSFVALKKFMREYEGASLLFITLNVDGKINQGSDYSNCNSFKSNDTVFLSFPFIIPDIDILIVNNVYSVKATYNGECNQYPEGSYGGTSYKAKIVNSKLVLKDNKLNFGDTIYGKFFIETSPYKEGKSIRKDSIYGVFISIIYDEKKTKRIRPNRF